MFEPIKGIPQPVPDPENPLYYKSVDATPTESPINGKPRESDDFQPRWNIRKQWDDGQLSIKKEIRSFCLSNLTLLNSTFYICKSFKFKLT